MMVSDNGDWIRQSHTIYSVGVNCTVALFADTNLDYISSVLTMFVMLV